MNISPDRLHHIIALARAQVDAAPLETLAALYFAQLDDSDAARLDDAALADRLASHFRLLLEHDGTAPQIRITNPEGADYSVIETVIRDRPFLIDTLTMGMESHGLAVRQLLHTIVHVSRDESGRITAIGAVDDSNEKHLSLMYARIDRIEEAEIAALTSTLQDKIATLDLVVGDWAAMREALFALQRDMATAPMPEAAYSKEAVRDFLGWMLDDNFTFLGYREYRVDGKALIAVGGSGLGLLRNDGEPDQPSQSFQELPENLRDMVLAPQALLLSKSSRISPVHRKAHMDFLGVQRFDAEGKVIGEHRFLGLFTRDAYRLGVDQIPLLREKAQAVEASIHLPRGGHAWKKLRHILDDFPRDDLFQGSVDTLAPMISGILRLHDKSRLRLFARVDSYQRFVSCLVYVPRDRFNTHLREKIQHALQSAFGGHDSEFSVQFEANHVRLHVHVRTKAGQIPAFDLKKVEAELAALMRDWVDEYQEHARNQLPLLRFNHRFPAAYREVHTPWQGRMDAEVMAGLDERSPLDIRLDADHRAGQQSLHFSLYGYQREEHFVAIMDILDRLGMPVKNVRFYNFADGYWIQRYEIDPEKTRYRFSDDFEWQAEYHTLIGEAFWRVWMGEVENDRLNQLVLKLDREVRDVLVLRALGKYMVQAGVPFSYDYIQQTLLANPVIAEALLNLFSYRMMPDESLDAAARHDMIAAYERRILNLLQDVKSLDEDRIIRWYLDLLKAMLRTNFYQREAGGYFKNRLSFKFAASEIPELPKPKPMFEIYVYSPKVEAVHLRGGKVARGGLRWSDRMEDFRTEVLGLVKAQMVKNAVIVPLGSKGGFVVKQPPAGREAWLAEGKECYRTFIRGLLDVTDNLVDGKVVPPADTVRHDGDDPYLVVAADKGTASFSDIANAISAEYGFWLGDAFASGGSAGYDHKGMGITARGAWESVKRHFRMMGKDIQNKDEFSVVGIGDMSGDVFGNGMLLSKNTLLKAAFNHLHIFIDPNPDAATSFAERERLFNLPRSTWADYNADLISAGGGVFSRQDKSIAISAEMKQAFAIEEDQLTPTELINRLLKAPVDLIWNGGIGTYVKHSEETHAQVGDRANDALRVNGNEIRAKVIGEGGNLGMTQRGRIEAALNGVRLNTDAIDNSGGVNCSDHEVNIKILLNQAIEAGRLDTAARNELLAAMTDSVAGHVLRQNYMQPQVIEIMASRPGDIGEYARIMRQLESEGRLDRAIEFLPDDAAIAERAAQGKGLTNPELAVLLAYSKMWVYDHLLASDLPDDACLAREIQRYFPEQLSENHGADMQTHRLKREIISTFLTNGMVNRMGAGFLFRATEESGESIATLTRCYVLAREIFAANDYWQTLEALDNRIPAALQIELEIRLRTLLERASRWLLRHVDVQGDLQATIARLRSHLAPLVGENGWIAQRFADSYQTEKSAWQAQGLPAELAAAFAILPLYIQALDVALLAEQSGKDAVQVADVWFAVEERLQGHWLLAQINRLPAADSWDRRARNALLASFQATLRSIVHSLVGSGRSVAEWAGDRESALAKADQAMAELQNRDASLATLSVVLGELAVLGQEG
ncbi:MAG: NAD-glutamate dehydrogenase [Cardiobacteriaceae bacterium]|nr:NAD-glutamate dehydrogenase [Cardiobacteriaceae bacterium]